MNYFAGRMHKMHGGDLKGMQYHNQRERESRTNKSIDKTRTHLNYDLVNSKKIGYKEKIERMIKEGVRSKRKIRSDAVMCNQWIITSDKGFFDRIGEQEEKRFFKESLQWFVDRYGKENIAFATVHKDEHTPHMHIGVIPITKDGRLSSKELFNRQRLKEIQEKFPKYIQKKGFQLERGIPNKQEHVEPVKYKNRQLRQEKEQLEKKAYKLKGLLDKGIKFVGELKEEKERLEKQLKPLQQSVKSAREIGEMPEESVFLNKDQVKVSKLDWMILKDQAIKTEVLEKEHERLREQNGLLWKRVDDFGIQVKEMRQKVDAFGDLSEKYRDLKDYAQTLELKLGIVESELEQEFDLELERDDNTIDMGDF